MNSSTASETSPDMRSRRAIHWTHTVIGLCVLVVFISLVLLGNWQLQRLAWKESLIDAVDTRAYQSPTDPPAQFIASQHLYARVRLTGEYDHSRSQRVKAVTVLGPGYWLMSPLMTISGSTWINRGFVPSGSDPASWEAPQGTLTVTGLLRESVPGGTLLEKNNPAQARWYSPDLAQLSAHTGLTNATDYYLDSEHHLAADAWPRGGMTQLRFRNNHLSYALTWYAMAAGLLIACVYAARDLRRKRSASRREDHAQGDRPDSTPPQHSTK
ncbi:MAG: SURF1 family protein [Pseudomonadota bacterium]